MSFGQPCDEFPLSSLPPLIRDAVIEAQQITQAPLEPPRVSWRVFYL